MRRGPSFQIGKIENRAEVARMADVLATPATADTLATAALLLAGPSEPSTGRGARNRSRARRPWRRNARSCCGCS